ncbi:MAG: SUF system Fe-S cluster assembly regulator [Ignavibacteria bacterium]
MLRLSKMTDYGTVIMAQMAARPLDIFSAAEVAAATRLSLATASKILKTLARHDLLRSVRGAKGGYVLARPPERISVAEVIAALEGSVAVTECGVPSGRCAQEASCPSRDNWRRLNHLVSGVLAGVSVLDMSRPLPAPTAAGKTAAAE